MYGTVDELSSQLGVVAAAQGVSDEEKGQLQQIQNELFNIGGYLATAPGDAQPPCPSLEDAALAHVARTVCRRAERNILALSRKEYVDPAVIRFVNRLSDYLFAAARYINFTNGVAEIGWQQKPKQ